MNSRPMSNIDKQALTAESARESDNILLIVAARMARRELFTPLHYVSDLPQKVVSMRVFREALERSEETLQREVCKIVDGHDRLQKKLKEAEEKLEAAEKRIAELEATVSEPVAFRSKLKASSAAGCEHWDYTDHRQPDAFELENCVIERLYTAPPAPVSVPDDIDTRMKNAGMLSAAEIIAGQPIDAFMKHAGG